MSGILGKKIGMSRIINSSGSFEAVTYVEALPNKIIQIKTIDNDGYSAIVLGFCPYKKEAKNKKYKYVREIKVTDITPYQVGQDFTLADLGDIDLVDILAVSKGRGFQGGVKRWGRHVIRKTHGTKYARHGSTMSSCITGRAKPGIKMPGRMGNDNITLKNRKVLFTVLEKNVYAVKGPLPGAADGLIILNKVN